MTISCVYPSNFRIDSVANALRFHSYVRDIILIDIAPDRKLRIEPGNLISEITLSEIHDGTAWMVPNIKDDDGRITYRYRKYINAWLHRD